MVSVRASQIFTHSVEEAVAARKELDSGADFLKIVERYSACPSKKTGGDLGWMNEESAHSLMGEVISEKDKGKILGPIHSPYGYHILAITDVKSDEWEKTFAENTPMIELNRKFPEANALLFKNFHIGLPVAGYGPDETVGSVCRDSGKPAEAVVQALNSEYSKKSAAAISPAELKAKIDSGDKNLVILDIREQWERDVASIEGSQIVTRENFETVLASLGKDREIALVDWKGDRTPSFQKWLTQRGFTDAKGLEGGIDAWAATIDTSLARYDIDEDDGYRYEDIVQEPGDHQH